MSIRNAQIVGVLNKSGHYNTKEVSLRAHLLIFRKLCPQIRHVRHDSLSANRQCVDYQMCLLRFCEETDNCRLPKSRHHLKLHFENEAEVEKSLEAPHLAGQSCKHRLLQR